jgi:hypothetical protein
MIVAMDNPRMFRVIVLGGISLVGACGGSIATGNQDSGFPVELGPPAVDASADAPDTSFPSELPVFIDSGVADVVIKDANKDGG